MSSWMETWSGRRFCFLEPEPEQVDIRDIAAHLAQICRYTGATGRGIGRERRLRHYSVAEHSVYCAHLAAEMGLPGVQQLGVLLHDAHEAYIGDASTPLKAVWGLDDAYHGLAKIIDVVIFTKFGAAHSEHTKRIDRRVLMVSEGRDWRDWSTAEPVPWIVKRIRARRPSTDEAMDEFLRVFNGLQAVLAGRRPDVAGT